ncbi:hypothetical protein SAMN05444000_109138 [Shimia gijangensis]|uniref:Uncharacterized protein n=1 Tax=Shimia gijangensis TaxID=1470563 RepID=A0A1M6JW79_9RHOB|nr:hypothetical protein SAMN05444000_109138 [Shimia gijangensis]
MTTNLDSAALSMASLKTQADSDDLGLGIRTLRGIPGLGRATHSCNSSNFFPISLLYLGHLRQLQPLHLTRGSFGQFVHQVHLVGGLEFANHRDANLGQGLLV